MGWAATAMLWEEIDHDTGHEHEGRKGEMIVVLTSPGRPLRQTLTSRGVIGMVTDHYFPYEFGEDVHQITWRPGIGDGARE